MKRTHKTAGKVGVVVVCGVAALVAVQGVQSERMLDRLTQAPAYAAPPSHDPVKFAERNQHARQLYRLWQAREKRDVTGEVAPFLQDPHPDVRRSAIRVLARLNTPAAQTALEQLLESHSQSSAQPRGFSLLTLQLALGRIRSRALKGRERVDALAQSVGLSWGEVVRLSQKVNVHPRSMAAGTAADEIVQEVISLLSDMGREGEDIQPLVEPLTLTPAQQVQLKAASMPTKEGVQLLLNYVSHLKVVTGDDGTLGERYIVSIDPVALDMLLQQMEEMRSQPQQYQEREGYVTLFRASAISGDQRAIAILKEFEKSQDEYISSQAMMSRKILEQQTAFPPFP